MGRVSLNLVSSFLNNFLSKDTKRAYENDLNEFIKYLEINNLDIESIKIKDIVNYRDSIKRSSATICRKMSSVKSFLNWLIEEGIIEQNPVLYVKLPKISVSNPTLAFSDKEVTEILKSASKNSKHSLILAILFKLGLRRSELVGIRKSDIMTDRGVLILKVEGKGGKQRMLPISSSLKLYFEKYWASFNSNDSEYLFPADDSKKKMNSGTIFRIVKDYARKCGINRRVGPHSCRATVISHLLEQGVSPRDVATFAGHSSINTTINSYDKKRDGIKNSAALRVDYEQV